MYTVWLKRISPWNVVIGGFAGCFAGFAGWAAAAGTLSLTPILVAAVDFLWTPGHLWGLAMKKMKEYKSAGIPMFPVNVGLSEAASRCFHPKCCNGCFLFFVSSSRVNWVGLLGFRHIGWWGFIFQNRGLLFSASEAYGFRAFITSMPYLACLMAGLILDKIFLI